MKPWLVVEDEDDIRNIVKVMFQVWGHVPMEFRDGHEAWNWLDAIEAGTFAGDLPEFALMDIRMPGHRGNEIAQRMRTLERLRPLPIVLMTAFSLSDSEKQEMLNTCGVDSIINKPLPDLFELKKILDDIYTKKQQSGNGQSSAVNPPSAANPPLANN